MNRESVIIDSRAIAAAPRSHTAHVVERNTNLGKVIARDILDVPFAGIGEPTQNNYALHGRTLSSARAADLGIRSAVDFYGAVVDDSQHVHKAVFHPSISGRDTAGFHSQDLAYALEKSESVLPGVTAFRVQDLVGYVREIQGTGKTYRLKIPNASDGEGQHGGIRSVADVRKGLRIIGTEHIRRDGIVLEEEIADPRTISVGSIHLGGEIYSFHLQQKDEVVVEGEKKRTRYLGAEELVVYRGSLSEISLPAGSHEERAREKAAKFGELYQAHLNPTLSRWSVDVVGNDDQAGIADLTTGRIGGTDPGLVLAVRELANNPDLETVSAEVTLDYGKKLDVPPGAWVFIKQPDLRAFSRVTGVTKRN